MEGTLARCARWFFAPLAAALLVLCALLCVVWALNVLWVVPLAAVYSWAYGPARNKLEGAVVLVTGGSSGIGKEVAKICAKRGARVVIAARNKEKLAAAKAEIEAAVAPRPAAVETVSVDLTKSFEEVEAALSKNGAVARQEVEFAILCAGESTPQPFEALGGRDWEQMLRLNLLGCMAAARAVLPAMKERRRGHIAFVSSMGGQTGVYGFSAYSASKFALRGAFECLRMELKPHGVGVSLVFPPDTDTPCFAKENEIKPIECKRISGKVGLYSAEDVARGIVNGVESATSLIVVGDGNVDGWMLNHMTVGLLPSDSWVQLFVGLFLLPLFRLISIANTWYFDRICAEEAEKRRSSLAAQ